MSKLRGEGSNLAESSATRDLNVKVNRAALSTEDAEGTNIYLYL